MNQEEKILLYWSGEADEATSQEIELLLENDPHSRKYFDELGELAVAVRDEEVPEKRRGLLDEVLNVEEKITTFPAKKAWVAIAALVVMGLFSLMMWKNAPKNKAPIAKASYELPEPLVMKTTKLSERLLTDSGSFREKGTGLIEARKERVRWERIRFQKEKI